LTEDPIDARCNWWGKSPPKPEKFYGPINYDPWLTSDPLPAAPEFAKLPAPLPLVYNLSQNYPNPFNPVTTVSYDVPPPGGFVGIRVYNVSGQLVRTLVNASRPAGRYETMWDGSDERGVQAASGIYFLNMVAPQFHTTRKILLLK